MSKFKEELQAALDRFDIIRAEAVADKVHEAEENGYELTAAEEKLLNKLTKCVQSYRRALYSL